MPNAFPRPPKIVVFTGPGLSRDSGFAPFDPATMPPGGALEDVVTRDGFARDPALVQDFYNRRRREMQAAAPNPAHEALAALDLTRPGEVLIVTRNIDDFHERAGNRTVIHTHGELLKARCLICTKVSDWFDDLSAADQCSVCGNLGHLRPHIVWVGEEPLGLDKAYIALATCETFVAIGSTGAGEPGRSFLAEAKRAGARTIELAAEPTPLSAEFDECRQGPLIETVSEWVKQTIGGR
ncbi:MAG TPA: Sir2 family NAD-dependent protein deacetylase [Stellaceae bacterium]|jgi:NAD-dependent deacetylase|nr:Sir2 family NAD-dependent protein deacetylase [Stellaceae bacterium]